MTLVEVGVALCARSMVVGILPVPWAGSGNRYTLWFELFVLSWLKISTVEGIMTRAVKCGLSRIIRIFLVKVVIRKREFASGGSTAISG